MIRKINKPIDIPKDQFKRIKNKILCSIKIDKNGCWLWRKGNYNRHAGICIFGTQFLAHRISYTVFKGPIPSHLCCLHKCDVPSCVNPAHLHLGTYKANTREMMERKRSNYTGSKGKRITQEDKEIVWELRRRGFNVTRISEIARFTPSTISRLLKQEK